MTKVTTLVVAFAVGVLFSLVFFLFNDADRVALSVIAGWFGIVLIPAAFVICVVSKKTSFLIAVMTSMAIVVVMLSGIFVGTCIANIVYAPDNANMFPIAAAVWTIFASVPVVVGSLFGVFGSLFRRKVARE